MDKMCECANWARTSGNLMSMHHENCPKKYENFIKVVFISHDGKTVVDDKINSALAGLADLDDGFEDEYTIKFKMMDKDEYDALDEFEGF